MNPCKICKAPGSFDEQGALSPLLLTGATGSVHECVKHLEDVQQHVRHHHESESHLNALQVYKLQERASHGVISVS